MAVKSSVFGLLLAGVVVAGSPSVAWAAEDDDYEPTREQPVRDEQPTRQEVPEINALSTIPAAALLLGLIALRRERNRKK